jgi:hypothetical protein
MSMGSRKLDHERRRITMSLVRLKCATVAAFAAGLMCSGISQAQGAEPAKGSLTQAQFDRFHKMIRPQPGEAPWLDGGIAWKTNLAEAQQQAAREGKPILIWHVGGAGYRDGLGRC